MASSLLAVLKKISEAVGIFYSLLSRVEIQRKPNILNVAEMTPVKDFSVSLQHSSLRDPVHSGGPAAPALGSLQDALKPLPQIPLSAEVSPKDFYSAQTKVLTTQPKGTLSKHASANSSPFHYPRLFLGVLVLLLLSQLFQSQSPCP